MRGIGEISAQSRVGRWEKASVQLRSNLLFKILTVGDATTEAGGSFQYFTTLTKKADPLLTLMYVAGVPS